MRDEDRLRRSDGLYQQWVELTQRRQLTNSSWSLLIKNHPNLWRDWTNEDFDEAYALLDRMRKNPLLALLAGIDYPEEG